MNKEVNKEIVENFNSIMFLLAGIRLQAEETREKIEEATKRIAEILKEINETNNDDEKLQP